MAKANLQNASRAKKDEFYTQLVDIEKELRHYKDQFRGKVVYCNCDDPFESNFFKYFAANFDALGLKKLITTSYNKSPIAGRQLPLFQMQGLKSVNPKDAEAHRIEINKVPDINNDGAIGLEDVKRLIEHDANVSAPLKGNGDFRSDECVKLLKQADIVVTNPPFSLFREFVAQLVEHDKKFLILGNMNAITYKDIFKLIKENRLWSGYGFNMSMVYKTPYVNDLDANRKFVVGKGYNPKDGYVKVPAVNWYTNLDTAKRHEELDLFRKYTPEEYLKYDNYDAIEVGRVAEIPMDYEGAMGVPITFLDKFNPDQFEIIWIADRQDSRGLRTKLYTANDVPNYNDLNRGPVLKINGKLVVVYMRILIKKGKIYEN